LRIADFFRQLPAEKPDEPVEKLGVNALFNPQSAIRCGLTRPLNHAQYGII
jgi:hypothetical protein